MQTTLKCLVQVLSPLRATSTLRPLLAPPYYPAMLYISSGKPYIHYISVDLPLKKHSLYAYAYAMPTTACSVLEVLGIVFDCRVSI